MITNVTGLDKKSFNNYSGPEAGSEFKGKNIVFGYNGRGKTSLALGIIDEFLRDGTKTSEGIRHFSKQFVSDSLLLEPSDNTKIKGVVANFGKKGVDTKKQILALENQIIETNSLEKEISDLRTSTRAEVDRIHNERKGDAAINVKPLGKPIKEVLGLYQNDVTTAKAVEPSESELLKIRGDNSFELQKSKLSALAVGDISSISYEDISNTAILFGKSFDDSIPAPKVIEWLNCGLDIHKDGDDCKFCGNSVDYNTIITKVETYNADKRQVSIASLNAFLERLLALSEEISILVSKRDIISANLKGTDRFFDSISACKDDIDAHIKIIQAKLEDTSIVSGFLPAELSASVNAILINHDKITKNRNDSIADIDNRISNQSLLVKGAIGVEISRSTLIAGNVEKIDTKEEELKSTSKKNEKHLAEIEKLRSAKSTTSDFAQHISDVLSLIGVDLKLSLIDEDYIIKHARTDESLTIEDISEGEQNLLALLYFYYELFSDKEQQNFKTSIEVIIIDDPISSVDDINRMYVLELIRKLIEVNVGQLFILTHSWEDFTNLCYGKKDKNETPFRFYEIKKDSNGSRLEIAKANEPPYRHHFKEIHAFSQKTDCSDMDECEIYHYPNVMRKILEEFLSFKTKNCNPTKANISTISKVLCGQNASEHQKTQVGTLLNVCNILSHKASRNPDETLASAKFLIGRIAAVDKQHFDSMIGE